MTTRTAVIREMLGPAATDAPLDLAIGFIVLWALPFAWIGTSMSVRRARDAGYSPWLPVPDDWVLKTGIAVSMRARIEGEGVGAIRHCEFTTGPFVEPITVWDPPHRLVFDVAEQPEPMHEWSPYEFVYAPHLENTMMSQRGEFELLATRDGGTILRGTTWYSLDLDPLPYWRLWSDFLVHRIHMQVLEHVKGLSEGVEG